MRFENAKYGNEYRKAVLLLALLLALLLPVRAQFVDIAIDHQAWIEVKAMDFLPGLQKPDGSQSGKLTAVPAKDLRINWIRIRTVENMVLMVEILYCDPLEDKTGKSAVYLNDGGDNLVAARLITGNRLNFPLNSNTWHTVRMNSPPKRLEAWIGVPAGTVAELTIGYN